MNTFDLSELELAAERILRLDQLAQSEIERLADLWSKRIAPDQIEEEMLDVCDFKGTPTGISAPRWLCHLLGLRHRATHIILRSPQNLLVLQVRSRHKKDWPNQIDTSVGGHVRAGQSFLEAGLAEMEQELGLPANHQATWLAGGKLTKVGVPYERADYHPGTPPFRNKQINQIYAGLLTPDGLARIRFQDGEVDTLYLCTDAEAEQLLAAGTRIAPGLAQSLPRYLAWHNQFIER